MKNVKFNLLMILSICFMGGNTRAEFVPVGVHKDVLLSTITNDWGWGLLYRGDYGVSVPIDNAFFGHGEYIMLGAIQDGSNSLKLLAATTWDSFVTHTFRDETHASNGAEWYNNDRSLGFAGLGDTIMQDIADISDVNPELRLSWHTIAVDSIPEDISYEAGSLLATDILSGYRAGEFLDTTTGWDRVIFTANLSSIPVPAAVWLFSSGIIMIIGLTKNKSQFSMFRSNN
jgi:hypothetical protein